jgi:prepilin-type N-terminal cleavage/methylation domain-containing protein/prepilin-type processing-associated H-X9-DG protein
MFSRNIRFARPRARAFTLVELLTVIAIVGVLAALVIAGLGQIRSSARQSGCVNNLRQIGVAWQLYLADHNGRFPEFATYQMYYWGGDRGTWGGPMPETRPLYPYLPEVQTFRCPSDLADGSRPPFYTLSGNSYVMANSNERGLLSRPEATNRKGISGYYKQLQNPARTILVYEQTVRASEQGYVTNPTASYYRDNWHNNDVSNILMADGHVETFQRAFLDAHNRPTINPPGYSWGWSNYSGPDW